MKDAHIPVVPTREPWTRKVEELGPLACVRVEPADGTAELVGVP